MEPIKNLLKKYILEIILILLICVFFFFSFKPYFQTRLDEIRKDDIFGVFLAQKYVYERSGHYFSGGASNTTPLIDRSYLSESGLKDPQEPKRHYFWLANNWSSGEICKEGQFFCVYAILDNKGSCEKVAYYALSEKDLSIVCDVAPSYNKDTGDCTCF
jgi:hypothetical protein